LFYIALLVALPLAGQTDPNAASGAYEGPSVSSPGNPGIGTASGQPTDLRFWLGASGTYDTGIQPLTTDAHGNLIHVPGIAGVSFNGGISGSHSWSHSQLSLSYRGDYRYYPNYTLYDGTNQTLALDFSTQYSSRWVFDARLSGFTLLQSTGVVADAAAATGGLIAFVPYNTRFSSVTGGGSLTYLQTSSTSYTFAAAATDTNYSSSELTSFQGYNATASVRHRISAASSIGASYSYGYQTASGGYFTLNTQSIMGNYTTAFAHGWSFALSAGVSISNIRETVGFLLPAFNADGELVSIIVPGQFKIQNVNPVGTVGLTRQFQRGIIYANGGQATGMGNGLIAGARNTFAGAGASYTGLRKWNFGIDAHYYSLTSLGTAPAATAASAQSIASAHWYAAGTGFTYELMRYTHLTGRFDMISYSYAAEAGLPSLVKRVSLGLSFAPKNIPLSLW